VKNTQYRFRCKGNPRVIYTPEFLFDVPTMRAHPEYEEIDADGNVIVPPATIEDEIKRVPMSVAAKADDAPRKTLKLRR
jgi:hypothetical protein